MKKILLVDDDLRAIEGIAANLDWDSMGIEKCICVSSAREAKRRIREEDIPAPLRGAPIVLICATLMSIAFMGFSGLSF